MLQKQINSGFFIIFESMQSVKPESQNRKSVLIHSGALDRSVLVDLYLPPLVRVDALRVLLINDGQDLDRMRFESILSQLYQNNSIRPLLCVGIHAGPLRKLEYGTAHAPDYRGRGSLAPRYTHFVIRELTPFIKNLFPGLILADWAFAGFSLGGLSALDITWAHPQLFRTTGVFSGSLWWRSLDKTDLRYRDESHRLMHGLIRAGHYEPGLKFFFECGTEDETEDRNNNGVIDSIDDTKDLMRELMLKGYTPGEDICYLEMPGGSHDPATWGLAMPHFLKWGWPA
ncbi:MAG: alpha/beta hydrolase-fold protein [Bacteroidota bacterium]|nr:alpha/beta hydrolase-fold protein [Bacteroidota bacterium]